MINISCCTVGLLATNCYIITDKDTNETAIIDPGAKSSVIDKALSELPSGKVKYILLTHGHFDHIGNVQNLKDEYGCKVVIGENDEKFLSDNKLNLSTELVPTPLKILKADIKVKENQSIMLGNTKITVIETPGHTNGGVCYIADDNIFCGDTLFKESMGRTDFPTGDQKALYKSLKKLKELKGDYNVFPGHGEFTTLEYERENNYCLSEL